MRPHDVEFSSEVLENALYTINNWDFAFDKKNCHWKCKMDDIGDLIELAESAFGLGIGDYEDPPLSIKTWRRVITIKQGDNQIKLAETLMIKFIDELKDIYSVYG